MNTLVCCEKFGFNSNKQHNKLDYVVKVSRAEGKQINLFGIRPELQVVLDQWKLRLLA